LGCGWNHIIAIPARNFTIYAKRVVIESKFIRNFTIAALVVGKASIGVWITVFYCHAKGVV